MNRIAPIGVMAAMTLSAQGPNFGPLRPEQQPDLARLARTVQILRNRAELDGSAAIRGQGLKTEFLLEEGADHDTIVGRALPHVFEFFDKQAGN